MNEDLINQLFNSNHSFNYDKIESPIERILLNHITKFLSKETKLIVQYPISTISGNFRTDIALIKGNKKVFIECDGEEYHTKEKDDWYDEWRDTLILIQKKAKTIYRIKGVDIQNNLYKAFYVIYSFDPDLFNIEYAERIEKFEIKENGYRKQIRYEYQNENIRIPSMLEVKRKELIKDFDSFWYKYVMYSLLHRNKNIYELIDEMTQRNYESKKLIQLINEKYPTLNIENQKQLLTLYNSIA